MSEKEMNSYKFVSGQEPSDEMLEQIMMEAAMEANQRKRRADEEYFSQMMRNIDVKREISTESI